MGSQEDQTQVAASELQGQAYIWQCLYSSVEPMALKCAVELRIADIIHSHGHPITLSQIATGIASPSLNLSFLRRLMRFLVHKNIFDTKTHEEQEENISSSSSSSTVYSLNNCSKWLLRDTEDLTIAPFVLMRNHPHFMAPLHFLSQSVKKGGSAFKMAHGQTFWDFASGNEEFNKIFNNGMECTARITIRAVISEYKQGLECINGSLVDIGGGTGAALAEIVKAYPHIKGINFDLPHVVATAPPYTGVTHLGGDMFEAIPNADAILLKWIMHNWDDNECVKILKNCRKAIPEKIGKIVIVDVILKPDDHYDNDDHIGGPFEDTGLSFDLVMLAHYGGGKERTELEWKKLLVEGGFPRYKIIKIPALPSIIEAYPH